MHDYYKELYIFLIVEVVDDLGFNVLHEAVLGDSAEMVRHLSKGRSASKRRKNFRGRTPLHLAAFIDFDPNTFGEALADYNTFKEDADENGRTVEQMVKLHSHSNWEDAAEKAIENMN